MLFKKIVELFKPKCKFCSGYGWVWEKVYHNQIIKSKCPHCIKIKPKQ